MGMPHNGPVSMRAVVAVTDIVELEPLDAYQGQLLEFVRGLLADGSDVFEITACIAEANNSLTRRLLTLAEAHLGPPPCRYAWLVLGSQGRGEQVLSSDQDSAIAYDGSRDGDEPDAREYFATLAELMVSGLDRAGLPLCDGGYMATNWFRPLEEFRRLFRSWVEEPQPHALMQAEVFLDVQACHGDLPVDDLGRLLLAGGRRGPFRVQMARAAVRFRPPLNWLGHPRGPDSTVDVKRGGTAAIVLLARLYALAAGSAAHSTVLRLEASAGMLSRPDVDDLTQAYRFLTGLRLRHQVEQISAGQLADNAIRLDRLMREDRNQLRRALQIVRDVQEITARRFATQTVT